MGAAVRKWKTCIVATGDNQRHIEGCIASLVSGGFKDDGIHVVCGKGVAVPNVEYVAKRRESVVLTEAEAWVMALEVMSQSYASTDELFLFVNPEIRIWPKLRLFADYTVETQFVGVYLPYTPLRYYVDSAHSSPPCTSQEAAWCEVRIDEPSNSCYALLLSNHACRLLASYLRDMLRRDLGMSKEAGATWGWADLFHGCVGRLYGVVCYAAIPSFAVSAMKEPVDYVGQYDQSRVNLRQSRYKN